VPRPFTAAIPVGTPMQEAAAQAGITDLTEYAVIDGGPMMGKVLADDRATVMKKTKAYIILKKTHPLIVTKTATDRQALLEGRSACEQCRMCTDICPRHLLGHNLHPHLLMRAVKYNLARLEEMTQANLCSQCGVCTLFACPAHLKPHQINFMLKQQLGANSIRYIPNTTTYEAHSARAYRRVPVKRLILRLGLAEFDREAPLTAWSYASREVRISLQQHVGAPAQPIVAAGTVVEKGQLIAAVPEGALSAAVHASVHGTVTQVNEKEITIKVG
jgi:Na+-translocating ferredoxin:NAD+ oxidoreductase RnfC subunit